MGSNRDIYLDGYQIGRNAAKKFSVQIHESKTHEELGKLAGQCLRELLDDPQFIIKNTFVRSGIFKEGLFDGFTDRADEMKSA